MIGLSLGNVSYFRPTLIPTLQVWGDCVDPSANGTQPANGASVTTLVDKSGKGNNCTQSTGSKKPTFTTSSQNGLPTLTFNSPSAQILEGTISGLSSGTDLCIYVACKSTDTGGNPCVSGVGSTSNTVLEQVGTGVNSGSFTAFMYGGKSSLYAPADTNFNILGLELNNSSPDIDIFLNNSGETSSSGSPSAITFGTAYTFGNIPFRTFTAHWAGTAGELVIFSSLLSASAKAMLYNYLKNRWGL